MTVSPTSPSAATCVAAIAPTDARWSRSSPAARAEPQLRALAVERGGWTLPATGGALCFGFASPETAVWWAIASQQALADRPADAPGNCRIGLHCPARGDQQLEAALQVAAQLADWAAPGGVCFSQAVYSPVKQRLPLAVTRLGRRALPSVTAPMAVYALAPPASANRTLAIAIAARPADPDRTLARDCARALAAAGYQPWLVGADAPGDAEWLSRLELGLQDCGAVLLLHAPGALQGEMGAAVAARVPALQAERAGEPPRLVLIQIGTAADGVERSAGAALTWRSPADTPGLLERLPALASGEQPAPVVRPASWVGAAKALAPSFYVERPPIETRARAAIAKPGALLCIKAPRQMGKTALLNQLHQAARQRGYDSLTIDFQTVDRRLWGDLDRFLQWFCASVSRRLGLPERLSESWDDIFGSKDNCTAYWEEQILATREQPLFLGLDAVDACFQAPELAADLLGLLRAWPEEAKNRPRWQKLRLALVYATEIYLPMDANQSPFNVGVPLELSDFTAAQARELAQRYGLAAALDLEPLRQSIGGQPYLLQVALSAIAHQTATLPEILATATADTGIYGDHLHRHHWQLYRQPRLAAALRTVVNSSAPVALSADVAFQLYSLGLVAFQGKAVQPRYELYRRYFRDRLV